MLRLRRALDSKQMTVKSCAELIGISEKSLYNKLTGASDYSYKEDKNSQIMFPHCNMVYYLSYALQPTP